MRFKVGKLYRTLRTISVFREDLFPHSSVLSIGNILMPIEIRGEEGVLYLVTFLAPDGKRVFFNYPNRYRKELLNQFFDEGWLVEKRDFERL